jgi:hypothetical protein
MQEYKSMGTKKSIIIVIAFIFAVACVIGLVDLLFLWFYPGGISSEARMGQQRQERLLCETDFQALLEGCREISRMYAAGDLNKSEYMIRINPDPEVSKFPQVILDLEPTYVDIASDGKVQVELFGGFVHYGVCAYPENYKAPFSGFSYGDRELIDGLWYYDDGYLKNPEYAKKIETLLQKRIAISGIP